MTQILLLHHSNFSGGLGWVNVKQETLQIFRCTSDKIEAGIECFQKVAKDSQPTTLWMNIRKLRTGLQDLLLRENFLREKEMEQAN